VIYIHQDPRCWLYRFTSFTVISPVLALQFDINLKNSIVTVAQRVNSNGVYNDIMLTNVQRLFLDGSLDGNGRTLSSDERTAIKNKEWKLWTDKSGNYIVPYYFDTKFPSSARDRVRKAIQDFTDTTCIRFTETRISDRSYDHRIRVSDTGKGCFSYVGLVDSVSSQDLSLDVVQCTDETWEIQHEFMHALGK